MTIKPLSFAWVLAVLLGQSGCDVEEPISPVDEGSNVGGSGGQAAKPAPMKSPKKVVLYSTYNSSKVLDGGTYSIAAWCHPGDSVKSPGKCSGGSLTASSATPQLDGWECTGTCNAGDTIRVDATCIHLVP